MKLPASGGSLALTTRATRSSRVIATLMAMVLLIGSMASCSPTEPSGPTALQATVEGDNQPTIEIAPLDDASRQGITDVGALTGFVVGVPVSIELDGEVPESGVRLTRTYAAPLPADAVATFAYWNAEYETWQAVPSTLSDDRRTVTAIVHHLSWWSDFIAGTQDAVHRVVDAAEKTGQTVTEWTQNAVSTTAEALHWSLGNIFTKRVDLPECDLPTPNWVRELPVGKNVDDPVRFCAGYDRSRPDLLVIKARANRGYGFPVRLAVDPVWEYNSSSELSLSSAIDTVGHVDEVIGNSMAELLNHGRFVTAGSEISFGIPAAALRGYSSEYLLELPAPSFGQFFFSTAAQQLVAWGVDNVNGTLAASIAIANCWSDFEDVDDVGQASGAVLTCLSNADTSLAQLLGEVLRQRGMQENVAGKLAGRLIGKISMVLAFVPAVISTFDYVAELNFPRSVRALTITVDERATRPKPISDSTVGNLLIPAGACEGWPDSRAIQLTDGQGENFDADGSGTGILRTKLVGSSDLNGDGAEDAVLTLACTGTPAAQCCAGRGSIITTIIALDVSPSAPLLIGSPITGGTLASSEGSVGATIYETDGHEPRLYGKDILTFEGPLYELDDPSEAPRISAWFRHSLVGGEWERTPE